MKWYRAPSKMAEICGSCNAGLRQNDAGTVQMAKTSSGLIRCRRCAEMVQGWCLWPKGQAYEEAEIVAPAGALPALPTIPGTWRPATSSQPWARAGGATVAEFKRRQTGEREED